MKSKLRINSQGWKLEYNPNDPSDVKLAIEAAREWHKRGAKENQLIAVIPDIPLRQAA